MRSLDRLTITTFVVLAACGGGGSDGPVTPGAVASVVITTPAPTIGALGRTRQLSAEARTAANAVVSGVTFTWNSSNTGVATIDNNGLVTSVANGTTTVTATGSSLTSTGVTVTVAQVPGVINVTSPVTGPDTLFSSARTRQYSASVRDSTNNVLSVQPAVAWSSSVGTVASVDPSTGLATALTDGTSNITATAGTATGFKALLVRRLAATHSVTPPTANITTPNGTQVYTGAAADSAGAALTLSWSSRSATIATVAPTGGTTTTATAVSDGTTRVILTVPAGVVDSATVVVTGQASIPNAATITVGDVFFTSVRNGTSNPAVDTVAVGGSVTWNWVGPNHSVRSTGSPSFTSSGIQNSGSYQLSFPNAGTYTYDCAVHGASMSGRVVIR